MADLMPSLSSDDENIPLPAVDRSDGDSSEEEDDHELEANPDFEFGGILGEDGGIPMTFKPQQGWSYQTALDQLQKPKDGNPAATTTPRMDVASLIAAKRQIIKKEESKSSLKKNATKEGAEESSSDSSEDEEEESKEEKDRPRKNVKKKSKEDKSDSQDESSSEGSDDGDGDGEEEEDKVDNDSSSSSDNDEDDDEVDDKDREMEQDVLKLRMGNEEKDEDEDEQEEDQANEDSSSEEEEDEEEAQKAADFFESPSTTATSGDAVEVFAQLTLSRPLLRGIATMGYVKPTPIQSSVIPVALAGRDICASAVTGSGKTAAFLLPIMERLLHRSRGRSIQALILTPTRELAAQCVGMLSTLSQFTDISSALIVGGSKNLQSQMAELRARPSVVVATPGRLLDHVTNSAGVSLEDVEFLVLDEADRLLDLGFQEEVTQLIQACRTGERQTMLFSATMNTKVDDLIKLSLKRPVRIRLSSKDTKLNALDLEVAPRLEQEFVRVRSGNEGVNREGMLLALLTRTFSSQTIVFFDTKVKAHRMMILCGLCGIRCAELHGNLTQTQRLEALEHFREGEVDVLLATDLAARGLDISRVETVINFEMPNQVETYIHRIGRTARAGRGGRSCTLIGEGRRHLMKRIMKDASDKNKQQQKDSQGNSINLKKAVIRSRSIPAAVIAHFVAKIESLESHVEEVMEAEAVAKMDRMAEMEANKAQNIIEHSHEINNRPKREWFVSEKEKKMTKEAATEKARLIQEKVGTGKHRMTRKKRRAREALQMLDEFRQEQAEAEEETRGDGGLEEAPTKKSKTAKLPSIKKAARDHKRTQEEKDREHSSKSVHDMDVERASKTKKKSKGAKSTDALGDSSLFAEEAIAYAPKKKKAEPERAPSTYNFRGFDASQDGRKMGKQKGHHKFKSKSKYKRR